MAAAQYYYHSNSISPSIHWSLVLDGKGQLFTDNRSSIQWQLIDYSTGLLGNYVNLTECYFDYTKMSVVM